MRFDKDRFDAFLALASFRRELRDARIGRQWQASFAVWALLAGMAVEGSAFPRPAVVLAVAIIFLMHIAWLQWHARRAEEDQAMMLDWHDRAGRMIGVRPPTARPHRKGLLTHPPTQLKVAMTAILSLAVLLAGRSA